MAVAGNIMLMFEKERNSKVIFFSQSNSIFSLAQDQCSGSREDVVEAMLVLMREEEMLKTRY